MRLPLIRYRIPILLTAAGGVLASGLAAVHVRAGIVDTKAPAAADAVTSSGALLTGDRAIRHALDRLAFGPRPGDVARVRAMGLKQWIEAQLHPETIADSEVEAKLALLPALQATPSQLLAAYISDQKNNQKRQKRLAALAQAKADGPAPNAAAPGTAPAVLATPTATAPAAGGTAGGNAAPGPMAMQANDTPGLPARASIETVGEMINARLLRDCESNRQLQEVLVDFWTNHFNEDVKKGPVRTLRLADERDAIRPHVFGKFRDLLEASAHSPAMLFYLDNSSSTAAVNPGQPLRPGRRRLLLRRFQMGFGNGFGNPAANNAGPGAGPQAAPGSPAAPAGRKAALANRGLNENYGRELMELHTLGVDGGYTQKDVQEVARCFTGWGFNRLTGEFQFHPRLHDNGQKVVLGHVISPGGGIQDGETVLDILASSPSTAKFISRELCRRFVSDTPEESLVDAVARVFRDTGGDLREVYRAIFFSPEFWAAPSYRSKMKSPFEYAVSSVRALGGTFEVPDPSAPFGRVRLIADGAASVNKNGFQGGGGRRGVSMAQEVALMGQPLFSYEAPTGYPESSTDWISSGGLLARFNYALALTGGQVNDVRAPAAGADVPLQSTISTILGVDVSPSTRAVLDRQVRAGATPAQVAALLLGSPEFQKK